MKILIYYPATQKTQVIECESLNIGPEGINWYKRGETGFIRYDVPNRNVTVVKD